MKSLRPSRVIMRGARLAAFASAFYAGLSVTASAAADSSAAQALPSTALAGWTVVRPGESAEIPAVVASPASNAGGAANVTWLSDDASGTTKSRAPGSYAFVYRFAATQGTALAAIPAIYVQSAGCVTSIALNGTTAPLVAAEDCPAAQSDARTMNLASLFPNAVLQSANTLQFTVFNRYQGDDGGTLALAIGPVPPPPPVVQATPAPQPARRTEQRVAHLPARPHATTHTVAHVAARAVSRPSHVAQRPVYSGALHLPHALLFCTNDTGDFCQEIVTFQGGVGRMKSLGYPSTESPTVQVDRLTRQDIAMHIVTRDGRRFRYHGKFVDDAVDGVLDESGPNEASTQTHWWAIPVPDYGRLDHVPKAFYACFGEKCDKDPHQANTGFYALDGREGTAVLPNMSNGSSVGHVYVISSTANHLMLRWTRDDLGETVIMSGVVTRHGDLRGADLDFMQGSDVGTGELIGTIPGAAEQQRIAATMPNVLAQIQAQQGRAAFFDMLGHVFFGGSGGSSSDDEQAESQQRDEEANNDIQRRQQEADEEQARAEENARIDADHQAEMDYETQRNDAWAAESQSQ